ncbi:serine hydrolase domain-containing protein [Streptomyces sp. MZ04]|uniref:serine hydrolase domain-containing protein n=1 Tax=Streptomyces sp. MZ04 TaxID=2559236 RepID=UPI00107EDF54|nr:serine hydrolase domain-containing protein [Streptomyces sp. MZ04]TGA96778.1 class A beta-lactamase-related serine hydrolase [Streptomyces sp. MZ04]
MTREIKVHGTTATGYEAVRDEFTRVLAGEKPDHAAQLAAYVRGKQVVDLWVGPDTDGDTLFAVYSSTKGAAHLTTALLVQDGILDLDREVAHYWPEFAAGGKGRVTLRELLSHRAGIVGADTGFTPEEIADDRAIAARLATQRPYWRPGTAFGYHALSIGALAGEVVFRVTGRTLREIYEERVRAPYGLDLHLGLPEALEPRFRSVLPMIPSVTERAFLDAQPPQPDTLNSIAFNRNGAHPTDLEALPNSRLVRAKGPASVGGVASARGLAGMYAAAVGGLDGREPLLKPDTVAEFGQIHSSGYDLVIQAHRSYGVGFQNTAETGYPFLGAGSIGHKGVGGSQAFADPRSGLAYGYTRRRFPFPGGPPPEDERLVRVIHTAAVTG